MALVRWKTSGLGIELVTGILACCAPEKAAAADPIRYTPDQVSPEPDSEILKLRVLGGSTLTERTYSLMGDGRLGVFTSRNDSGSTVVIGKMGAQRRCARRQGCS